MFMRIFTKLMLTAAALGVLAAVFSFYGHGDFVMSMANQVWGCF
ncbi:putative membrane protein [Rhodoferax antarcticus ANT.BR]|uniref:Putative membrane protein n=1 Tax=Rhodoferax antarcticus ANT.BR TaxID=1111071 RepID=A0A1Q8YBJ9_9BURK|nr:putative membrane protein [Rhodoferax antarcticus ANT.BR]